MWLVPDLNFVAIGISDVQVWFARTVLAVPEDRCSYSLGFLDSRFDAVGRGEAEAKVVDPARQSVILTALESEHVVFSGSKCLNVVLITEVLPYTKERRVEGEGYLRIVDREADMGQTVCLDDAGSGLW